MSDIFISYSQRDRDRVKYIADALEARGLDVFWDPEIPPGETWDNVIARNLKASRCVIVVWSETSQNSDWVKEEAEFGKQKRTLVPVQIDHSGPPLGFTRIQTANLADWQGEPNHPEWLKVLDRIVHHGAAGQETERSLDPREARTAGGLREALYDTPEPAPAPPSPPIDPQPQPTPQPSFRSHTSFNPPKPKPPKKTSGARWDALMWSASGRISKTDFWKGFGVLFGLNILFGIIGATDPEIGAAAAVGSLILLYPTFCVYGKRLHDLGKTAWLYPVAILVSMIVAIVFAFLAYEGGATSDEEGMVAAYLGMLLVMLAFTLWVGLARSDPQTNKHGPPADQSQLASNF